MPDIFAYTDYRAFLRDAYEEGRADGLSHRSIGHKGGFDPGLFSKVVNGERAISLKMAPRFARAFALGARERRYFELLVRYDRARTPSHKRSCLEQILGFRGSRIATVARERYEFYDKWYYSAIRELLNYYRFDGDYAKLARRLDPPILPKQAKKAIVLLERLGFLTKDKSGAYCLTEPVITTGPDTNAVALDNFVQQGIGLAKGALDRAPKELRNLSSLTMSVPLDKLPELVARVRAFRREILETIRGWEGQDAVYQLSMQLFPLTKPPKGDCHE